jgi:phospholipase C
MRDRKGRVAAARLLQAFTCICFVLGSCFAVTAQSNPAPTLASISPNSGTTSGGTAVTLGGSNFVAGATVTFGKAAATAVSVVNSTTITANTPPNPAGTVGVTVTNPDGQSATLGVIQPLTNTGFESGTANWVLAGSGGTFTVQTNPANGHNGSNNYAELTVQASGNHPVVYAATSGGVAQYFPVNPGDVLSFGGYGFHVSGDGKARWGIELSDANKANKSYVSAAPYNVTASTWTQFSTNYTVPAGMAFVRMYFEIASATGPAVDRFDDAVLQRTTPNGSYTYLAPQGPPTITSLSATQGANSGGDTITISGSNFLSGATVTFGGISATNVSVVNSATITANTPPSHAGSVDVTVTNPGGQSATLASWLHNQGFESGLTYWKLGGSGGSVVVGTTTPNAHVGTNYLEVTAATGSHPVTYASDSSGNAQYFPVSAGDTVTFGGYAYRVSGSANARWGLEITDANKANPSYVSAQPYSAFDPLWTAQQASYTVPAGKSFVRLYAEIGGGSSPTVARFDDALLQTSSGNHNGFTFLSPPIVTSVSPAWGAPAGGTTRTVYGTGFRSGATVMFGSLNASNVQVVNANAIEVFAPQQGAGTVSVTVDQGLQFGSLQNAYTYRVPAAPPAAMLGLKHIIYTFQENRAFDNYFSKMNEYRQMNGISDNAVDERDPNKALPDIAGQPITPFHFQTECHENLQPSWNSQHYDYDGGKMDNFLKSGNALGTSAYDPNGTRAIGYYDYTDFPYYYDLAFKFATSDRWFSSVLGPTDANRMYTYGATSLGWTATAHPPSGGFPNYTIFDLLDQAGISWKYYYQFASPLHIPVWSIYQKDPGKFVPISNYTTDLNNESTFPQVAFIEEGGFDEHPKPNPGTTNGITESVQQGASTIRGFISALMKSPVWTSSAFVLSYDEGGGLADHVLPAAITPPDGYPPKLTIGQDASGLFNMSGVRVPVTVVSPWTKPHLVSHIVRDHTAILKFIETRFSLPPLTARDDASDDMSEFFDFTVPSYLTPPALATQPTTGACNLSLEKAPGQ